MAKTRANGEGSIYRRKDGRWVGVLSVESGGRKAYYGKTRQDVARKLTAALKATHDGLAPTPDKQTVAGFLTHWLETVRPSLRPRTWVRYEQYVRIHVLPHLGGVRLSRLGPDHLQALYATCLDRGLSPTSVAHLHRLLHRALGQAAKWGLIVRNVARLVDAPRMRRREMRTLSPSQARRLLDAARGDRFEALYVLALTTGMRQGELLGLRWRDVNFQGSCLTVVASLQRTPEGFVFVEPKSTRSRRRIALSGAATSALGRHQIRQAQDRLRGGPAWEDIDLVFANEIGRPVEAGNLIRRSFVPLLDRAELERIRFHDLRHTAATLMLGSNVHPKVVAEMLGHSQISVTLDLYSHVTPTMQLDATRAMDALLTS